MEDADTHEVRRATVAEAATAAALLDAFNREFDTPTPGPEALAARIGELVAEGGIVILLAGQPAVGVAVISLRPCVWTAGPAALLDELYVRPDLRGRRIGHGLLDAACTVARDAGSESLEINVDGEDTEARRFYEAHGFAHTEPGMTEPSYYYYREL
jgi:GNAT superfamily N-acetyltransferase